MSKVASKNLRVNPEQLVAFRMLVGGRIVAARREAGLSQPELAVQAGIGVATISNMERGEHGLNLDNLFTIALVLDRDPSWFLGAEGPAGKSPHYSKLQRLMDLQAQALEASRSLLLELEPRAKDNPSPAPAASVSLPDSFFNLLLGKGALLEGEAELFGRILQAACGRLGCSAALLSKHVGQNETDVQEVLDGREIRRDSYNEVAKALGFAALKTGVTAWTLPKWTRQELGWNGPAELRKLLGEL